MSWDALGAWRLVVDAPADLTARPAPPGRRDTGIAAAERLHLHRTTLYYRLDRIAALTCVDLRDSRTRTDLQLALWLDAYRRAAQPSPSLITP